MWKGRISRYGQFSRTGTLCTSRLPSGTRQPLDPAVSLSATVRAGADVIAARLPEPQFYRPSGSAKKVNNRSFRLAIRNPLGQREIAGRQDRDCATASTLRHVHDTTLNIDQRYRDSRRAMYDASQTISDVHVCATVSVSYYSYRSARNVHSSYTYMTDIVPELGCCRVYF